MKTPEAKRVSHMGNGAKGTETGLPDGQEDFGRAFSPPGALHDVFIFLLKLNFSFQPIL